MGGDGIAVDRLVLVDLVLPRAQDRVEPFGIKVAQPHLRARAPSFSSTTSRTASVKLPRRGWQ
jgi:primosomal replication protein N